MDAVGVINHYLFDFDKAVAEFRYKKFEHYDAEWLHFIVDRRSGKTVWKDFDLIVVNGVCLAFVWKSISYAVPNTFLGSIYALEIITFMTATNITVALRMSSVSSLNKK